MSTYVPPRFAFDLTLTTTDIQVQVVVPYPGQTSRTFTASMPVTPQQRVRLVRAGTIASRVVTAAAGFLRP